MSFSGVCEDHSVLLASGPSPVAVWKGESYGLLACLTFLYWTKNISANILHKIFIATVGEIVLLKACECMYLCMYKKNVYISTLTAPMLWR